MRLPDPYYQDEFVTLYHGDNRQIAPLLGEFDLLLTDPPYGINENARKVASRANAARARDYGSFTWDKAVPARWTLEALRHTAKEQIIWGGELL